MTETIAIRTNNPTIHYYVAMSQPESHLFEVTLQISGWQAPILDLIMPVWTPGSYLVREYSRHLQYFNAIAWNKQPLASSKLSKNQWQIATNNISEIIVSYRIFANELTVRTNHLDSTHGYFNPAALCFYIPGAKKYPIQITIIPYSADWQITTALPPVLGQKNTFYAEDFDTLVDSPFEIGEHHIQEFDVLGKSHQLAVWGKGNLDIKKLIPDIKKIVEVEAKLFDGLPYNEYIFLLHLSAQGFGGLEHKYSCTLSYNRLGFRNKDQYERFLQLVAHEFFHLWNVKRLRPKALQVFDYTGENYTPSLWFSEGTTSFYDLIIPYRAGIYDVKTYLEAVSKEITRLQTTPGRLVQSASESSFDAWIKLYRPDANSNNSQISYYLKGELVSFLLDLLIRKSHENTRSFDDVMRQMWQQFGKAEIGFTPEQLKNVIESVAQRDLSDFFKRYIHGVEELPYDEYLQPFGLKLAVFTEDNLPYLGINAQAENGKELIKFVHIGSPAQLAGIDAGDQLLALDGWRVTAAQLNDRLKDYQAGDIIDLTVFHQDQMRTSTVKLAAPRPHHYQIVPVSTPSLIQEQNFYGWLGTSLKTIN